MTKMLAPRPILRCPHRRYHHHPTHYECVDCGERLERGEPETERVDGIWADLDDDESRGRYLNRFGGP